MSESQPAAPGADAGHADKADGCAARVGGGRAAAGRAIESSGAGRAVGSERLDRRMLDLWRLRALLTALVLAVVAGGATVALSAAGGEPPTAVWILGALGILAVLVGGLAWASADYRNWSLEITDEALELRHGVLVRSHSTIPFHRVQQIDIDAGPLDRMLGLRRLMVRTAASTSDATIPGVAVERAEGLRRRILREAGEGDAV